MIVRVPTNIANPRRKNVNSHESALARRLKPFVAQAARAEPVKVLALKTGISPRVIQDLREQRHLPSAPTFLLLAQHDPTLRAQAIAIMSGDGEMGTPENVQAIIRFMQERR